MNKREDEIESSGNSKSDLTVIILTFNESRHIERCVQSVKPVAKRVLVVDSGSSDDTVDKAIAMGARVLQNAWTNYTVQMNWAIDNGEIDTEWVMRLDADEVLDWQLANSLKESLESAPAEIRAFEINRRIRFMGREIKHGGVAPMWVTRVWRNGSARCEARWMDEHMVLNYGGIARLSGAIIDENLNSLTWWTQKHNGYASREAVDLLDVKYGLGLADGKSEGLNGQARIKRWLKNHVYSQLPLGVRPWLYFLYRSVFRLGFLDGSRGMLFHTLQGLWYRELVDAKVTEVEDAASQLGCGIPKAIHDVLGIDVNAADGADRAHGS